MLLTYWSSIWRWSMPKKLQELGALPAVLPSLLCWITYEQIGNLRPVAASDLLEWMLLMKFCLTLRRHQALFWPIHLWTRWIFDKPEHWWTHGRRAAFDANVFEPSTESPDLANAEYLGGATRERSTTLSAQSHTGIYALSILAWRHSIP